MKLPRTSGRRLVGGEAVIDSWGPHGSRSGKMVMTAGQKCRIVVAYSQDGGPSYMRLYWRWQGQEKISVSAEAFWHSDKDASALEEMYKSVLATSHKVLTAASVWDYFFQCQNFPVSMAWVDEIRAWEEGVQSKRR